MRGVDQYQREFPGYPQPKNLAKSASIGHHHNPANNKEAGISKNTNPEQLARVEAPPVLKAEGALSEPLVEVPFRGAPVELDTLPLVVLSIVGAGVDVTVSAAVGGVTK
jgi:hypothetical protein